MASIDVVDYLRVASQFTEAALEEFLPSEKLAPQRLHQAMRYAIFAGGKRLRPALILASAQVFDQQQPDEFIAPPIAPLMAGIEILHTYTLVHDDLPAMDDDDMRRGRPSCHKKFDEATAILCGDALLTLAMECMAIHSGLAVRILTQACGSTGVVGGQQDDLDAENHSLSDKKALVLLERIQKRKTAALIRASCELGALCVRASASDRAHIADFGEHIGCAFQITDDILDVTADADSLGKTPGKDHSNNKLTSVSLLGLNGARARADEHIQQSEAALDCIHGDTTTLRAIAQFVIKRGH